MTEDKVGLLEEQALKRKERLLALKKQSAETQDKSKQDVKLPTPKFRSYKPQDENFKDHVVKDAKAGDVQALVQDQLNLANSTTVIEELDINTLQPRKPDWDLKRDVTKKLEKLERRTQKAIAEIIRDRLKQTQENLAAAVNMVASQTSESKND